MAKLILHPEKIADKEAFVKLCPFGAISLQGGTLQIDAGCKMCRLCIRKGPPGGAEYVEEPAPILNKSAWKGVAVLAECSQGAIHPVSLELLGEAEKLASKTGQKVYALLIGHGLKPLGGELLHYGVDEVHLYDQPELELFRVEAYAEAFCDFVQRMRPCAILVGATVMGRQLAPRAAARLRTGLTADCTQLDMQENTDLIQIRPAFGGNIMAQILTPRHRPQMATVRYKVMEAPARRPEPAGKLLFFTLPERRLHSGTTVLEVSSKPPEQFIDGADVLVTAGRGIKKESDLQMLRELAELLGGQLACTRPLAECGWVEAKRQIGLSGRTVRPRLLITCGVSGAIQFVAGMNHADTIIAINKDEKAPIFRVAHYGLVGDAYDIVPRLIDQLRGGGSPWPTGK